MIQSEEKFNVPPLLVAIPSQKNFSFVFQKISWYLHYFLAVKLFTHSVSSQSWTPHQIEKRRSSFCDLNLH